MEVIAGHVCTAKKNQKEFLKKCKINKVKAIGIFFSKDLKIRKTKKEK